MASTVVYFVDLVDFAAELNEDVVEIFLWQVLVCALTAAAIIPVPIVCEVEQR